MPLTYGFRQYPPRAQLYTHPFTGATIATPVLDLVTDQTGVGTLADRSGYGNNGTVVGDPTGARGVFADAQKLDGVNSYVNCGSLASLDIASDISASIWVSTKSLAALSYLFSKNDGWFTGWSFRVNNATGLLTANFNAGSSVSSTNGIGTNRLAHAGFTVKSNVCRVFLDGLQEGRGAVTMTDDGWADLYVGANIGPASYFPGSVELPQEWNGAISPEQMYRNYLQAENAPILHETLETYPATPVAKATGAMCGPFRVASNSMSILIDSDGRHWMYGSGAGVYSFANLLLPQPFSYGTFECSFIRSTVGSGTDIFLIWHDNAAAGINGYGLGFTSGGMCTMYRYAGGGVAAVPFSVPLVLAIETRYQCRVVRRPGGVWSVYIKGGVYTDWMMVVGGVVDNTYTLSNSYFGPYIYQNSRITEIRYLYCGVRPPSAPFEISTSGYGGVMSGGIPWTAFSGAGVLFVPKDLDWTKFEFGVYKGADANVLDTCFVASEIGGTTFANQNGYCLRLAADESIQLIRMDAGVETLITSTAAGFIAITTEYTITITHNGTTNAYDFFISGGGYASGTSIGIAATLGIHVSGNYVTWDCDAGDRVSAPAFSG
jgi:hypothetical protein